MRAHAQPATAPDQPPEHPEGHHAGHDQGGRHAVAVNEVARRELPALLGDATVQLVGDVVEATPDFMDLTLELTRFLSHCVSSFASSMVRWGLGFTAFSLR